MDSKYKKLGKNTMLVFLGQAGTSLISLLMLPLYTNWLTTEEYGTVDLMNTYASILISLVSCCVADAIFIFPKDSTEENKRKYFTSGLLFVGAIFVVSLVINLLLTQFYKEGTFLSIYSWQTIGLTACIFLQRYTQQFTRSLEKMGVFATTGIVYTIGVALLAILLIPSFGLQGYILSLILSHLIASLYAFLLSKSYKYFGLNALSRSHLKTLLVYGIPLIPNTIMWWMVNGLNRPIMENYLGLSAIGLYAVASKFPGIVSMMSNVLSNAWGISVLDEFGKPGFSEFFNKTFRMLTFFSFVIAFFLILFSKYVIMLFTSESFYDAWHVLPLLIVGAILNSSTGLVGGVFMGMKKSVYFFYSSAASAVVSVIATFLLIQPFGIIGCAVASAVSFLVALVLRLIFAWKYIKGFDILQYTSIILVLVFTNIVLELSLNMVIKIVIFTILFSLIIIENRNLLIVLKNNFKWKRS